MNDFRHAKEEYESTPIPAELEDRVRAGIRQGKANRARRAWSRRLGTVAACFVVMVGVLNLSPTVAAAAADVPVLGGLFQVLTVRSFTDVTPDRTLEVEQPAIQGGGAFAQQVNEEIQKRVDAKTAESEWLVAEYKEAFLATGGTQEEWEQHNIAVSVKYDVKSQTDTTVSFLVESDVSFTGAYWERTYYNLDLAAGEELTLADVLGEDWVTVCNDAVKEQMSAAEDPSVYFTAEQGGFTTVDETTQFYLDEAGDPVVVFPPYAVAPGAMGYVEFPIGQ